MVRWVYYRPSDAEQSSGACNTIWRGHIEKPFRFENADAFRNERVDVPYVLDYAVGDNHIEEVRRILEFIEEPSADGKAPAGELTDSGLSNFDAFGLPAGRNCGLEHVTYAAPYVEQPSVTSPRVKRLNDLRSADSHNVREVVETRIFIHLLVKPRIAVGGQLGCEERAACDTASELKPALGPHGGCISRQARRARSHCITVPG
jgi:hypothetical protein